MRLAVPTENGRVSPGFDSAGRVLLVGREGGEERSRYVAPLPVGSSPGRVTRLHELGVSVLMCGGISRLLRQLVDAGGIRVHPWMAGPVDGVLLAYRQGRIDDARKLMSGCGDAERFDSEAHR